MINYTCNDEENEIFLFNKNIFDTSLMIIKNTGKIDSLGQYQLDILMKGIVNFYASTEIEKCDGNNISSSALYDNFIETLKRYNVNENLINHMSCVKFVNYFGKNNMQTRKSEGKSWINIKFKNSYDHYDPLGLIMTDSIRTNFINNNFSKLNYDLDLLKCISWYQSNEINCNELIDLNICNNTFDFVRPYKILITCVKSIEDINHIESLDIFYGDIKISTTMIKELILNNLEILSDTEFLLTLKNMPYFIKKNYCNESIRYKITTTNKSDELLFFMINEYFICFGNEIRTKILSIPQIVPTWYTHKYSGPETKNIVIKISSRYDFENILKGIIVDADCDIKDLLQVKFIMNGAPVLVFDKLLLKTICKKINSSSIYIPIGNTSSTIYNKFDLQRIDSYEIHCQFAKKQKNLNIHFDMFDILLFKKNENVKHLKGDYGFINMSCV